MSQAVVVTNETAVVAPDFTPDHETLEAIAGALRAEVRSFWGVADLIVDAVEDARERWPSFQRLARAAVLQAIAEHCDITTAYARQLDALGRAFGKDHPCRQLAAMQLARALVRAATRLDVSPPELFNELQREDRLRLDVVVSLGRHANKRTASMKASCHRCNMRLTLRCAGQTGLAIRCPVCASSMGTRAGAPLLGQLE